MKIREFVVWVILAFLVTGYLKDHVRLIEVRQLLMDKGTPIEMDQR